MKKKNDIGRAIVEGAWNTDSKDTVVELGEVGIDAVLSEGLLEKIPILRTVIACRKTWAAIHDQLFLRKVAGFMLACPAFTEAEREASSQKHLADPNKNLGNALVLILGRLDDLEKPKLLAKAFAALVRRKIELETFRRLASSIDIGFIVDLQALANEPCQLKEITDVYLPNLHRAGLVDLAEGVRFEVGFKVNNLGRICIGCMNENYDFTIV